MTKDQILKKVKKYPGAKVKLAITDMDGVLRGKVIATEKFLSILKNGFGFCDVVFGWDAADALYDNVDITGWHTGFPDANAKIDLNTFREVPWDNDIPFFLADFRDGNDEALEICPRNLLKNIETQAKADGFKTYMSQEFEWFNFDETPWTLADKDFKDLRPLTPGMFGYSILRSSLEKEYFNDLFDLMSDFKVPIEGMHTETGPGVYEAAIKYSDPVEAADRAVLFKTGTKEIAYQHGIIATFMAKWNSQLPGCSGHVHQSLWGGNKSHNLFYDSKDKQNMSALMKSYIAGQLHCLPYILPMFAPNINSFKRLVEGAWAPTTLTWGVDNRTTALRVITSGKNSSRLESRVCGSDTNPYLALAACLASGLYGIRKGLKLKQPATKGNGYEEFSYGKLPGTLQAATQAMKNSKLAKDLFGKEFVDHFTKTREWEVKEFRKNVKGSKPKDITHWELKRYFEII